MNQHVPPPADELPSIIPAQGVNVAAAQVAGRSCARSDRAPLAVSRKNLFGSGLAQLLHLRVNALAVCRHSRVESD